MKTNSLEFMLQYAEERAGIDFSDVCIVCVQHIMRQSVLLTEALLELNAHTDSILFLGKCYSTCGKTVSQLRKMGIYVHEHRPYEYGSSFSEEFQKDIGEYFEVVKEKYRAGGYKLLLVLDDGGALSTYLANQHVGIPIVAVEQTSSGFWAEGSSQINFPVIDVAASALKRLLEPKLIAEATIKRCLTFLPEILDPTPVGLIGFGYLGKGLGKQLKKRGNSIRIYDTRTNVYEGFYLHRDRSVNHIFDNCSIIFGSTGTDILRSKDAKYQQNKDYTLLSTSSGDIEFLSIKSDHKNQLAERYGKYYTYNDIHDIEIESGKKIIKLVRQGFPVNFDNSEISVPLKDIDITLSLLLTGLCQAKKYADYIYPTGVKTSAGFHNKRIMLASGLQKKIAENWFSRKSSLSLSENAIQKSLNHISYIEQKSLERTMPEAVNLGEFCDYA